MKENENIFDKLKELFGANGGNFNILQSQIDVDLQVKYFDLSREVKKGLIPQVVMEDSEKLFSDDTKVDKKKEILAKLASVEEVEAFRVIEKYLKIAPDTMKAWTSLAYQESKMMLESKLLDENQVLISTGLGGKGFKLRYFVVILSRNKTNLTQLQKKIIQNEFTYILEKHDSEVESFNFSEGMATVLSVIPMDKPVKAVFEEAIEECNNYGNFLDDNFIITNVKTLSFEEVREFLNNKHNIERDSEGDELQP
jgi:hypothetical protein